MGMIDISEKEKVPRRAVAEGKIKLSQESVRSIQNQEVKKGDVLQVAEIAAIQAVKDTPRTLPHCHPSPIEGVDIRLDICDENELRAVCEVKAIYKTGVEMEALVGVNAALLTVWDMVKYLEKDEDGQYPSTKIQHVTVKEKIKGEHDGS
ncbi:MAG: cyclic pyranopterin monophosphate synthase MoaC [Candidatus Aenigmatarchaeota archaeon]